MHANAQGKGTGYNEEFANEPLTENKNKTIKSRKEKPIRTASK